MKKFSQFEFSKKYLYDKDLYIKNFIDEMLCRCYSMFDYDNLPNTIKKQDVEKYLLLNGHCIFTEYNGKYYIFDGNFTGTENVYHRLHRYLVVNEALNLNKEYETDDSIDCVLVTNNSERQSFYHIFSRYGIMLNDSEISLNMLTILNRMPYLITSADAKTKANAELFLNKIKNGDFSIVMDNAFLESIKSIPLTNNGNTQIIQSQMELGQYIKANAFNAIGLNANWNSKRERLNTSEIDLNEDSLTPLIENMLYSRKQAVTAINEKYNLKIAVNLANIWEQKKQEIETSIADLKDKENYNELADTENTETEKTDINENVQSDVNENTQSGVNENENV